MRLAAVMVVGWVALFLLVMLIEFGCRALSTVDALPFAVRALAGIEANEHYVTGTLMVVSSGFDLVALLIALTQFPAEIRRITRDGHPNWRPGGSLAAPLPPDSPRRFRCVVEGSTDIHVLTCWVNDRQLWTDSELGPRLVSWQAVDFWVPAAELSRDQKHWRES